MKHNAWIIAQLEMRANIAARVFVNHIKETYGMWFPVPYEAIPIEEAVQRCFFITDETKR